MSDYKDRGIIKWAPFDALTGHTAVVEEMIFNINKRQKSVIFSDEYAEFDRVVNQAVNKNEEISVDYFVNGYTYSTYGKIKKIDFNNKYLILDTNEAISFDSVMNIKLVK